jgi:hypothetical protein
MEHTFITMESPYYGFLGHGHGHGHVYGAEPWVGTPYRMITPSQA